MRRSMTTAALALGLLGLSAPRATAYEYARFVEGGVVTPGVAVNFSDLRAPAIDGEWLAFCGTSYESFGKNGFYRVSLASGQVEAVATESTASPSGGGSFRDLCITSDRLQSLDGGDVAFTAASATKEGVYLWDGGLITLVDEDTDFPDTSVVPNVFEPPSLGGRVAITWSNSPATPYFAGVHSFDLAGLFTVIDTNPTLDFDFFGVQRGTVNATGVLIGEGAYVWQVFDTPSGPSHVYRRRFDPLGPFELIASTNLQLPDESFVLAPSNPQVDRSDPEQLCFVGGAPIGAIYRYDGTEVERVADFATAIPDGTGVFTGFGLWCAIEAGEVVFEGRGSGGQWGVYRGRASGALERVVDRTIALDGAFASQFSVWREAISDGRIAFRARIGSNDEIWVTPEPGAALAAAVALGTIALRQRRRAAGRASASSRAISASTL